MSAVVQATTHPALDALAQLGGTAEQYAAELARLGVTGARENCYRCPVANYLTVQLGLRDVQVDPEEIEVYLPGPDTEPFDTPKPVSEFVERFDAGEFDELLAAR